MMDDERQRLRRLLLDGAASPPGAAVDQAYFAGLRDRVRAGLGTGGDGCRRAGGG